MKSTLFWLYSNLPVFIAAVLLVAASVICSGCYTLKQGSAMLNYLSQAVPLENIVKNESSSEEDRAFAQRVEDIRRFAMDDLGLKESKNYTRYVELDRDYLAAIVSASAKDSFTRHEWWFPVAGRVPYKGFFNVNDARKERLKLEKKDLDVWIRGVDAFSTLGWFKDPLYSYMKKYSTQSLAELIIHELFHATAYFKNHSQFNEELAEFVGTEGARLYMEKLRRSGDRNGNRGGSIGKEGVAEAVDEAAAKADGEAFRAFIRNLTEELDEVYRNNIPKEEKLRLKEAIIRESKTRFEENYEVMFTTESYRGFMDIPVNNAYLELYRLYYEEDQYYKELYEKSGRDLPRFITAAKSIKVKRKSNPKTEMEKALNL